jgi:hypothetical protein
MKDTVITVKLKQETNHEIRIAGTYDSDKMLDFQDAVEMASNIDEAVSLLEDEDARVLEYDDKGTELSSEIEWDTHRESIKKPANVSKRNP